MMSVVFFAMTVIVCIFWCLFIFLYRLQTSDSEGLDISANSFHQNVWIKIFYIIYIYIIYCN